LSVRVLGDQRCFTNLDNYLDRKAGDEQDDGSGTTGGRGYLDG